MLLDSHAGAQPRAQVVIVLNTRLVAKNREESELLLWRRVNADNRRRNRIKIRRTPCTRWREMQLGGITWKWD